MWELRSCFERKKPTPSVFFRAAHCGLALNARLYQCRQLSVVSILADFKSYFSKKLPSDLLFLLCVALLTTCIIMMTNARFSS